MRNNKLLAAVCVPVLALSVMTGCSSDNSGNSGTASEVNLKDMLISLSTTEKDLGLEGKYETISEVQDGSIDKDLVGNWKSADGSYTYRYQEDGTLIVDVEGYGSSDPMPYTCIAADGLKLVCEEMKGTSYKEDGTEEEYTQLAYTAYKVQDDTLYMVIVDSVEEYTNYSTNSLVIMYKEGTDAKLSASLESLYGEWETDMGEVIVIDENGLSVKDGPEELSGPFALSFNDGKLVVEGNGTKNEYAFAIALSREYSDDEEKTVAGTEYAFAMNYTGTDENDRPNLADIMTDWHAEYDYDEYLFNFSAKMPAEEK